MHTFPPSPECLSEIIFERYGKGQDPLHRRPLWKQMLSWLLFPSTSSRTSLGCHWRGDGNETVAKPNMLASCSKRGGTGSSRVMWSDGSQ